MSRLHTSVTYRRTVAALAAGGAALALGVVGVPQAIARPHRAAHEVGKGADAGRADRATFDVRAGATPAQRKALERRAATDGATSALRSSLGQQAIVDIDGLTGTPRQVARLDGFLTAPSGTPARDIAVQYVSANLDAFGLSSADLGGLRLERDYVDIAGIHHISWVQYAGGVPLFGNGLKANVASDGRLISVLGSPVPQLSAPAASGIKLVPTGTDAIALARKDLAEASTTAGPNDTSRAVLFQTTGGTRAAWETITMSAAHPALHVIDAENAKVLFRQSLSDDLRAAPPGPATATAYRYFPKAPNGGFANAVDYTARGWLAATATKLSGNNTHTFADVNDDNVASKFEEIPPKSGNSWNYKLVPFHLPNVSFCDNPFPCSWNPDVPFSWRTNRNQNAAQIFFFVNNWHDHLAAAPIGFTEAAGNFQNKNAGPAGVGHDAVQANTDDGANGDIDGDGTVDGLPDGNHIDNANMNTPPDGQAPTMQMYLQHTPGTTYPDEDPFSPTNVGDEADTVYHEYTHGLSNRLVVDANGTVDPRRRAGRCDGRGVERLVCDGLPGGPGLAARSARGRRRRALPVRRRGRRARPHRADGLLGRQHVGPLPRHRHVGPWRLHLRRLRPDHRRAGGARRRRDLGADAVGPEGQAGLPGGRVARDPRDGALARQPVLPGRAQRDPAGRPRSLPGSPHRQHLAGLRPPRHGLLRGCRQRRRQCAGRGLLDAARPEHSQGQVDRHRDRLGDGSTPVRSAGALRRSRLRFPGRLLSHHSRERDLPDRRHPGGHLPQGHRVQRRLQPGRGHRHDHGGYDAAGLPRCSATGPPHRAVPPWPPSTGRTSRPTAAPASRSTSRRAAGGGARATWSAGCPARTLPSR